MWVVGGVEELPVPLSTVHAAVNQEINQALSLALTEIYETGAFIESRLLTMRTGPLNDARSELVKVKPQLNVEKLKINDLKRKVQDAQLAVGKRAELMKQKA